MARSTYSPRNLSHHTEKEKYQKETILLDFHSTKQGLPLVDSWTRGLDLAMHPAGGKWRDTVSFLFRE